MRRRPARDAYEPVHINVVPLVDVMFFLVLFFVATSSFERDNGVPVEPPTAQTAALDTRDNIVVGVTREREIWIEGHRIDPALLRATIERLATENANGTVVIAADGDVPTRLLVRVLDEVRLAGVDNAAIATRADDAAR